MDFKRLVTLYGHPTDPMVRIQRDFNDLVSDLWRQSEATHPHMLNPSLDVEETDKALTLHAELPGLEEKDIALEIHDHVLIIRGEKKIERQEENKRYHILERTSGFFSRSIQLPESIARDAEITASFKNGVLSVIIPKKQETEQKVRKIDISRS
jgi:HSP20 family protein